MFKGLKQSYRDVWDVLNKISQEQVFYEYFNFYPDISKRYLSPFRQDKDPGCRFTWHSGILYFVENTMFDNKLYWSCIDIVKYYEHCSYKEALNILYDKVALTKKSNIVQKVSNKTFFPEIRFEKDIWSEDNIFNLSGEVLEKELVFKVKAYWIKTKTGWLKNSIYDPSKTLTIAYFFPETNHVKLYFPDETKDRWYSSCNTEDIFGYHKLKYYSSISDTLIITKSAKDRLMLDYFLEYPSIALQNEGCLIPDHIVYELNIMFKHIYILYDNDIPGIINAQKLSQKYNWPYLYVNISKKDTYDMIKEYGVQNTKKLITCTLSQI